MAVSDYEQSFTVDADVDAPTGSYESTDVRRMYTADASAPLLGGARLRDNVSVEQTQTDNSDSRRPKRGSIQKISDGGRIGTVGGSVFNLLNAMIGVGVLALPTAMTRTGLIAGSAMIVLCGFLVLGTLLMMEAVTRGCRDQQGSTVKSYPAMVRATMGERAGKLTEIVMCIYLLGTSVSYSIVVAGTFNRLVIGWNLVGTEPIFLNGTILDNRQFLLIIVSVTVLWPLVLLPSVEHLRWVSLLATASMLYVGAVITWKGLTASIADEIPCNVCRDEEGEHYPIDLFPDWSRWTELFSAFSTFSFAFMTHTLVPQVLGELKQPTAHRGAVIMGSAVITSGLLYSLIAVMGYLQFAYRVCPNVIESYVDSSAMTVGQGAVMASVIAGYPTNVFPFRQTVEILMFGSEGFAINKSWRSWCFASGILATATTIAVITAELDSVIAFNGAFGGSVFAFLLPCAMFTNLRHPRKTLCGRMATLPGICTILALILVVLNTSFVVFNIVSRREDSGICSGQDTGDCLCGEIVSIP